MNNERDPRTNPREDDVIFFDGDAVYSQVQIVDDRKRAVHHLMNDGRYLVSTFEGWREFAKGAVKVFRGDSE